ncbi:MAG: hypothetical protein EB127_11960 [Alphaproteobacteria bacterium]|jgi:hypothetical protein|nr:hypothetical protein [Alphaproteobacteria bacterium]
MDMSSGNLPKVGNVRRKVIEKNYAWGLYVYKKASGKWFTDGEGSVLNIPAMRGDISKIAELKKAAMYYGDEGDGECIFVPGLSRVSEEQYSEMKDRMKQGLIPNVNDLGAVYDAQQTLKKHGREAFDND